MSKAAAIRQPFSYVHDKTTVSLSPSQLGRRYDVDLREALMKEFKSGILYPNATVVPDSVAVTKVGELVCFGATGIVRCEISYSLNLFIPSVGDIYKARLQTKTAHSAIFGVMPIDGTRIDMLIYVLRNQPMDEHTNAIDILTLPKHGMANLKIISIDKDRSKNMIFAIGAVTLEPPTVVSHGPVDMDSDEAEGETEIDVSKLVGTEDIDGIAAPADDEAPSEAETDDSAAEIMNEDAASDSEPDSDAATDDEAALEEDHQSDHGEDHASVYEDEDVEDAPEDEDYDEEDM